MREHGFLVSQRGRVPVGEVAEARGQAPLITARPEDRLAEVIGRMRQHAVSQLPVVDAEGRLLGLVSEVELLDHMLNSDHDHLPNETIAGMVNDQVSVAGPGDPLDQVLPDLLSRKVVVLTDEARRPSGILTVIDALEFVASGSGE
jgi:cystathionine beta-synthase